MPQDRFLHPRFGHSDKVTQLTDFEFRVWATYLVKADDFGIMRNSAVTIQDANDALAEKPARLVERALQTLVKVGLLVEFEHQGRRYVCQLDWQEFQKVRYPRESSNPRPPAELLHRFSEETRKLFLIRSGNDSGNVSETVQTPARAGGRERLRLTATANATAENAPAETEPPKPARAVGRTDGAMAGMLPRDHLNHAACDLTFSRCVPQAVHDKLANLLAPRHGGDRQAAKASLMKWYETVWASLPADFVMGEAFRFWQGRFDATFATADAPRRPGADSVAPRQCKHDPRCADEAEHTRRAAAERRQVPA